MSQLVNQCRCYHAPEEHNDNGCNIEGCRCIAVRGYPRLVHITNRMELRDEALVSLQRIGTEFELEGDRLVVQNAICHLVPQVQ